MPWRIDLRKSWFHWENFICRGCMKFLFPHASCVVLLLKRGHKCFPLWPLFHNTRTQAASGTKTKKPWIPRKETCRQTDGPPELCTGREGSWPWGQCTSPPLSPSWKLELQKGTPGWVRSVHLPSLPLRVRGRKLEFVPKEKEAGVRSKREPNKYPQFIVDKKTFESAIRGIRLPN